MAATKTEKTLADYVAIAVSPVLIMALVGSLVFFLVAVLYHGEYAGRLHWILFFFVFGAVLIARMSMQGEVADRAGIYGFVLGLLVWLALLMYVDWQHSGDLAPYGWLIDLGLIAVIWWCAHRLTWDCTLIDDTIDASGAGLLQVAGLEGAPEPAADSADASAAEEDKAEEPAEKLSGLIGWWERYRRHREEQKRKPHTPGVWVVYFSLAALPVFGLGQSLIPPAEVGRRQYVFWLMIVYVGSGLGLLVTTSFLGLRRYLRQRKLQMPAAMTGVWMTAGGMLIGALLLVGALMPRPNAEYPLLDWGGLGSSPERQASRLDVKGGTAGKDRGRQTGKRPRDAGQGKDGADEDRGGEARDQGHEKDGKAAGKDGEPQDRAERDAPQQDARGDRASRDGSKPKHAEDRRADKDARAEQRRDEEREQDRKDEEAGKGNPERREGKKDQAQPRDSPPHKRPTGSPPEPDSNFLRDLSRRLATLLKWLVGIIVAVLVLFVLLRSALKFLANFTHWARRLLETLRSFWQGLWGWWGSRTAANREAEAEADAAEQARPFSSFRDPFLSGSAERMSPEQLVRYSFEALQAWAQELDLGRQPGETPLEFAGRVGEEIPALETAARRLVNFYAQIAYARGSLTRACREPLRQFWQLLIEVVERPMSAGVGSGAGSE